MTWKKFKPLEVKTPEEIINLSIEGFEQATGNLVALKIFPKSEIEMLRGGIATFRYDLVLHSKYVRNYKYNILEVGYNISLFPCFLKTDRTINEELRFGEGYLEFTSQDELSEVLNLIFESKKFNEVVSGLMRIAEINSKDSLPF